MEKEIELHYNKYPEVNFSLDNGTYGDSELFKQQRKARGWDSTECWNLDTTIAKFILPRLKEFREIHCGHPSRLGDEDKWNEILDKMISAFDFASKEADPKLSWKELEAKTAEAQEGFKLFAEYYFDLWD